MKVLSWPKYSDNIEEQVTYRHLFSSKLILQYNPKIVLDIGCGSGALLSFIPAPIFCVGLERTEKKAIISLKNGVHNIVVADASQTPFKNMVFDSVSMLEVLEHMPANKQAESVKEIYRILKIDSELIISVPYNYWISKLLDPAWMLGHKHFLESEIKSLLSQNKFSIKFIEIKGGFWELTGMLNVYASKWIFGRTMVLRSVFEHRRRLEYEMYKEGIATLFAVGKKQL